MNGCGVVASIELKGMSEFVLELSELETGIDEIAKKATYEASDIVADEMRKNMGMAKNIIHGYQMNDLQEALGIAPIQLDNKGGWNTSVGFDGYGSHPTKAYPEGLPNQLLVRAIESGTSFRPAMPFVRKTENATSKKAKEKMEQVIENEIGKLK